jgi:excisionase family DNA binding protein
LSAGETLQVIPTEAGGAELIKRRATQGATGAEIERTRLGAAQVVALHELLGAIASPAMAHRRVDGSEVLSLSDAAYLASISYDRMRRAVLSGRLPSYRFGRTVQLLRSDVLRFAQEIQLDAGAGHRQPVAPLAPA